MSFRATATRATAAILTLFSLAAVFGACGGISSPSQNQNQDFTGTLQVGGSDTHPFNTSKTGEFTITITDESDRTVTVGTALGQMVSGGCSPLQGYVNPYSRWNQQALGGPIQKGGYCAVIYDPGTLTAKVNYTLHVSFP